MRLKNRKKSEFAQTAGEPNEVRISTTLTKNQYNVFSSACSIHGLKKSDVQRILVVNFIKQRPNDPSVDWQQFMGMLGFEGGSNE